MKREIKFRVWDKVKKVMMVPRDIQTDSDGNIFYIEANSPTGEYDEGDLDVFKLEQFTGLKDANGKEIYKGDIVRMQRPGFHEYACYEVEYFIQDVCIFQIVKVTDGSTLFESPSNGHDVEIIGNIHENPELLEEDK